MAHVGRSRVAGTPGRAPEICALVFALGLGSGCGGDSDAPVPPDPLGVTPAGRLVQQTLRGPILHTTAQGWRTIIQGGTVTVRPPEGEADPLTQYVSQGMREHLGTLDIRAWAGDRRSIMLPGGAKITLHGQGGQLIRLSIYDGTESHEVDVLTQTVMRSQVDSAVAISRDDAEHDGETAHLAIVPSWPGDFSVRVQNLLLVNLYEQNAGPNGVPLKAELALRPLGRHAANTAYAYSDPAPVFPTEIDAVCAVMPQPAGGMTRHPDGSLEYASRSGLWTVRIDQHQVIATRTMGGALTSKWEVWGDPHENLNGKHIKDWEGTRRTLLLDDGIKITMDAQGPHGVVQTTSIYDGAQSHEIGNAGNQLLHSCINAQTALQRDAAEHDGETAYLAVLRSPASVAGSLFIEKVYTETPGTGETIRIIDPEPLGETGELDTNPTNVNDFYDDPRLGHT